MSEFNEISTPSPTSHSWRGFLILAIAVTLFGLILVIIFREENTDSFVTAVNGQTMTRDQFEAETALQELKNELTGRDQTIDKPALLNRMIGDMLLLEAAATSGVDAPDTETQAEIDLILARFGVTRDQMTIQLIDHGLTWSQFENSVHDYLTITHYVNEQILAEVAIADRREALDEWMAAQYQAADMQFDQDFLDSINSINQ